MSSPKGSWTWAFHSRSASLKAQAAPLIFKGHRAKLSSTSSCVPAVDEHPEGNTNANLAPLQEEDPSTGTVLLAPTNTSKLQRRSSYSDMSQLDTPQTQAKDSLPTPVQSKSTGDAPESFDISNIKRFLMQEIDSSQAAAPLTAYCFMTGFMYVIPIVYRSSSHLLSSVMQSASQPFSFGVHSKRATQSR